MFPGVLKCSKRGRIPKKTTSNLLGVAAVRMAFREGMPSELVLSSGTIRFHLKKIKNLQKTRSTARSQIRRDKITEKMKQLESLVPHRHKKDKASMLEEIIEYVKFMQLQVQVSSRPSLASSSRHEKVLFSRKGWPTRGIDHEKLKLC